MTGIECRDESRAVQGHDGSAVTGRWPEHRDGLIESCRLVSSRDARYTAQSEICALGHDTDAGRVVRPAPNNPRATSARSRLCAIRRCDYTRGRVSSCCESERSSPATTMLGVVNVLIGLSTTALRRIHDRQRHGTLAMLRLLFTGPREESSAPRDHFIGCRLPASVAMSRTSSQNRRRQPQVPRLMVSAQ